MLKIPSCKTTGNRHLGRPRRRCEDNIRMDPKEIGIITRNCYFHVARKEEGRSVLKIPSCKTTGNRPLGRPRRRCEDNIRMDLKEIDIITRNWIVWIQDRDY